MTTHQRMTAADLDDIRESVRSFVRDNISTRIARSAEQGDWAPARAIWLELARLGWLNIWINDDYGADAGTIACIISEELAVASYPLPYVEVASFVIPLLDAHVTGVRQRELLADIVSGQSLAAHAIPLEGLPRTPQECMALGVSPPRPSIWIANHLAEADVLLMPLCAGDQGGMTLVERPAAGWGAQPMPDIANSSWCTVDVDAIENGSVLMFNAPLPWEVLARAFDRLRLTTAAYLVGLCHASLELSVQYAKDRTAFGRPIGAFQAVQQRLAAADMEIAGARLLVLEAAVSLNPADVAMACLQCAEASTNSTFTAQQIWGAMGFSLDVDAQLYFRRARACQLYSGTPWQHGEAIWTGGTCQNSTPG